MDGETLFWLLELAMAWVEWLLPVYEVHKRTLHISSLLHKYFNFLLIYSTLVLIGTTD